MIKRELKVNFKNFIIWASILIGIFLVVFAVYPFIATDESMKSIDEIKEGSGYDRLMSEGFHHMPDYDQNHEDVFPVVPV